jgi:two-component system, chemotaxis family, sensor kinase Cph1
LELEAVARLRLQLGEIQAEPAGLHCSLSADLARSNEELDAFTQAARYDLKEPLRGIHRYAIQLMEDEKLLHEGGRDKLDRMMQLSLRMDSLLDSLLHFSSIGKADLLLDTANSNELVTEALEMVGRSGGSRLEFVVPRELTAALCNRSWCREIFVNLLSNAATFNVAASRRVEVGFIRASESHPSPGCPDGSDGHNIYYVTDNGICIEAEHFSEIFVFFKRLHPPQTFGPGAGTGLTLARKLVERHGGKMWLGSLPGRGTSFYFTLPCGNKH